MPSALLHFSFVTGAVLIRFNALLTRNQL